MSEPKLPSAEELARNIRLYTHVCSAPDLERTWDDVRSEIAEAIKADRRAVLEAAAQHYTERQEKRWREFFGKDSRNCLPMMLASVKRDAGEIRKLAEELK